MGKKIKKIHLNNPASRDPAFAQRLFDSARQPAAWLHVGRNLRSSADAIFDRERLVATDFAKFPPPNLDGFLLLVAYSIENFLKGLIVAKEKVKFTAAELPGVLKTHDFSELNKLAAPRATIRAHLLDNLTHMAEWRGRYPIPISVDQFWPMRPDGTPKIASFSCPQSYCEILLYCDHIEAKFHALVSQH